MVDVEEDLGRRRVEHGFLKRSKHGHLLKVGSRASGLVCAFLLILGTVPTASFATGPSGTERRDEFMFGIDGTMTEALKRYGLKWYSSEGVETDPLVMFGRAGVTWFRMGINTNKTGSMGLEQGLELARWARNTAYKLYLFFYLSPTQAGLGKQPAPEEWESLGLEDRAHAIREYMRTTVGQLLENGLSDHVYEIGNEIDYGIAGVFGGTYLLQGDSPTTIERLANDIWKVEAQLLAGAIRGTKEADPDAKIVLHVAHWWSAEFARAFFDFMRRNGVNFDMMGLSFYPSSGIVSLLETTQNPSQGNATKSQALMLATVRQLASSIRKPIVIAEYAYPSSPNIHGPFSWFNKPVSDYPLTPEGQRKWIEDQLSWAYDTPEIQGTFYFQPEFYGPKVADFWEPFSLFDESGRPKPAVQFFLEFAASRPELAEGKQSRALILDAWGSISKAQRIGGAANLDEAISKLKEAVALYLDSKYDAVVGPALEAKRLGEEAASQGRRISEGVLAALLLSVALAIPVLLFHRIRKSRRRRLQISAGSAITRALVG